MNIFEYKIGDEFYLKRDPNLVIKIIEYSSTNLDYIVKNVNNYTTPLYIDSENKQFYVYSRKDYFNSEWKQCIKTKLDLLISL